MGRQWTEEDPGAGATGSLQSLAAELGKAAGALDSDQTDIQRALGVFPNSWSGLAADAAKARIEGLKKQAGELAGAAESVKKAVRGYASEVEAIKALADEQIRIRDTARKRANGLEVKIRDLKVTQDHIADLRKRQELEAELKEARDAEDGAVASLERLAKRRQKADDVVLKSVRSVIAEHWDVPPGDWPSERGWDQQVYYDYSMSHYLGISAKEYTAKDLMDVFKEHPDEIFPFTTRGPKEGFRDGAVFELSNTLPGDWGDIETGDVVVETTDTSVKFTVISDAYFDGPGSTIEFSIEEQGGYFYLRKDAHAENAQAFVAQSATTGAFFTWWKQADRFKDAANRYGSGAE